MYVLLLRVISVIISIPIRRNKHTQTSNLQCGFYTHAAVLKRVVVEQTVCDSRETYVENLRSISFASNTNRVALCLAVDGNDTLAILQ